MKNKIKTFIFIFFKMSHFKLESSNSLKILSIFLFNFLLSCKIENINKKINKLSRNTDYNYFINIKKKELTNMFKFSAIINSCEGNTYIFTNKIDSSLFYISDNLNNLNFNNIKKKKTFNFSEKYPIGGFEINKIKELKNEFDTFTINGIDTFSYIFENKFLIKYIYWKNYQISNISIGYLNCTFDRKENYEKIINLIKFKLNKKYYFIKDFFN